MWTICNREKIEWYILSSLQYEKYKLKCLKDLLTANPKLEKYEETVPHWKKYLVSRSS